MDLQGWTNRPQADVVEVKVDNFDGYNEFFTFLDMEKDVPTILTLERPAEQEGDNPIGRESRELVERLEGRIDYVDVELDNRSDQLTHEEYRKRRDSIIETAHENDIEVIVSYHDYESTPSLPELEGILESERSAGADLAKICTTAEERSDNYPVMNLVEESDIPIVAWAMGEEGLISRYLHQLVGGEWSFASYEDESAPGQRDIRSVGSLYHHLKDREDDLGVGPLPEEAYKLRRYTERYLESDIREGTRRSVEEKLEEITKDFLNLNLP